MKIEGREVIGKETEVSARTLLSFSAVVVVIHIYKIQPIGNEHQLLGFKIPAEVVEQLSPILLFFFLIGHILHWYSDLTAFRNWFKISEAPVNAMDEMGRINGTMPLTVGLEVRLQTLKSQIEDFEKNSANAELNYRNLLNEIEVLKKSVSEIHEVLGTISAKHQTVTVPAFLLVYIWYLAVPFLAFVVALYFLFT